MFADGEWCDLAGLGIPRIYLTRLHRCGLLERPSRGVYVLADGEPTEQHDLVEEALTRRQQLKPVQGCPFTIMMPRCSVPR